MTRLVTLASRPALWLTLALMMVAGVAAAADRPVGVIDSERIVQEYTVAKDAQEQFQRFMEEKELEIAETERELQRIAEEIESQKMLLGEDALRVKIEDFEQQKARYFEMRDRVDTEAENEYKAKIQPIIDQVKLIVERIGKEEGFGLIIDVAAMTTLYIDSDVDLTDRVLVALERGTEE